MLGLPNLDISTFNSDVAILSSDIPILKSHVAIFNSAFSIQKSNVPILNSDVPILKSIVPILNSVIGVLKWEGVLPKYPLPLRKYPVWEKEREEVRPASGSRGSWGYRFVHGFYPRLLKSLTPFGVFYQNQTWKKNNDYEVVELLNSPRQNRGKCNSVRF